MPNDQIQIPYDWIKEIQPRLLELDDIPLLGRPPEFPWKEFSSALGNVFEIEKSFSVSPKNTEWRAAENLREGISTPFTLSFTISGLSGSFHWVASEPDLEKIMSLVLNNPIDSPHPIEDSSIKDAFTTFVALQVIHSVGKTGFDPTLTIHLLSKPELQDEDSLTIDISTKIDQSESVSRLILPNEFLKSWRKRYSDSAESGFISSSLAERLMMPVDFQLGQTSLSHEEWAKCKPGDFLLLDECHLPPGSEEGRITLMISGKPFYSGHWKEGQVKILESIAFDQAGVSMEPKESSEENDEKEPTPPPFEDTLEEEDLGIDFEDEEDDLEIEEDEEEFDDEEDDSESEKQDDEASDEKQSEEEPASTVPTEKAKKEKALSAKDLPLTLSIEIGRVQIPAKDLLDMQPGNLLELDVKPENGVDLVINGRFVGRGELLRIGETLGVRIVDFD